VVPPNGENALNKNDERCFVCGGTEFENRTTDYRSCLNCGHEVLVSTKEQGFIINDNLSEKEVRRMTGVDRFKARTLSYFDSSLERKQLLDIGSASGKFLLHNACRYKRATGIEITPESLTFSRQVLGLNIIEDIQKVSEEISAATAWHSLEHIPEQHLQALLDSLSNKMTPGGRFVVSVPNGSSWQYRCFGKAYAYYDVPNHLHQFTPDSLDKLMQRFGFKHVATVNSWPYNTFGYTQSLLNVITHTHNYLYFRLKRRIRKPSITLDIVNGLLLIVCVPAGWLLGLADTVNLKNQGVITACFEKKAY
jgi:2-polyprenyl-3-methyl-5-hydroxy-6-metoxy-1,4-benzoquinol methylase